MNPLRYKSLFLVSGLAGLLLVLSARSAHAESRPPTPRSTDATELDADSSTLEVAPEPGTAQTTAASLQTEALTAQSDVIIPEAPPSASETASPTLAQEVTPGRATRSGPSYVGVGGNIGFGGCTALGRGSFTAFSKIGLTNNLSARPAVNISRRPAILLPVTVDFPLRSEADGRVSVAPYVGGGIVISTGRDSVVRGLVTGGVDLPISNQLTGNAAVNVGFLGRTEVGLRLGVGYNF